MNLLRSINPATNELLDSYAQPTDAEMMAAVDQSYLTFLEWRKTSVSERTAALRRTAELLDERQEELARLITLEMGKAIAEARGEIAKCAWLCRYYADNAENFLAPERVETEAVLSYLRFDPIGIVLAIMPWNFPFWQVFRFAAPALMAGNAGLLKHAANVSGCGRAIEGLFRDAGFPEGLFLFLPIGSERVAQLLQHPKVRAATLTGSEKAGRAVAREAGNLIKKTVLELGGSDAYLVLEDADLELAARVCAQSRLINAGQSCIGAKRFIVVEAVHDRFVELFREQLAAATSAYVILSSPLLLETSQKDLVDCVVVVDVAPQVQLQRTMARDANDEAQVRRIMAAQMQRDERLQLADIVIDNSRSLAELDALVNELHREFLCRAEARR